MSSMPLPALHVNPPADPAEGMQRILAMKGMLQQQQMQGVQLQQQQMELKQRQALQSLYMKHNGNLDGVIADAPAAGIMPDKIQALQMHKLDIQQKYSTMAETDAKTGSTNLDTLIKKNGLMRGAINAAMQVPDDQLAAHVTQTATDLTQQGLLDPQHAQAVQQLSGLPPDEMRKQLKLFSLGYMSDTEQATRAKEQAQTAEANARAGEATAQTNKINTEINPQNPANPDIRKQKYEGILQKVQSGGGLSAVTPEDLAFAHAYENGQRKTTTQSDTLGVTSVNTSGPSGLAAAAGQSKGVSAQGGAAAGSGKAAQPAGGSGARPANAKDSLVDMIGNYKLNPMMLSRMMAKHPEVIGAVNSKYPDWNQTTYNAKNKMVTNMASGPEGKTLDAINTAMGHIKNLDDAIDALHNGNVTALNNIGKIYNMNFAGKTPEAAFQLIVHRVGPEIASAYIPGGGGQGERMADEKDFDVNLPPQTLHNNAAITVNMLRSKIGAIENRYKNIVGRDDFDKYLTPEAKASLQKMAPQAGGGGGTVMMKAPNGQTKPVPADQVEHYKALGAVPVSQ